MIHGVLHIYSESETQVQAECYKPCLLILQNSGLEAFHFPADGPEKTVEDGPSACDSTSVWGTR